MATQLPQPQTPQPPQQSRVLRMLPVFAYIIVPPLLAYVLHAPADIVRLVAVSWALFVLYASFAATTTASLAKLSSELVNVRKLLIAHELKIRTLTGQRANAQKQAETFNAN